MEKAPILQEYPHGRRCENCEFMGIVQVVEGSQMVCRKLAPRVSAVCLPRSDGGYRWVNTSIWPDVSPDDWCGDFTARPESERADTTAADSMVSSIIQR